MNVIPGYVSPAGQLKAVFADSPNSWTLGTGTNIDLQSGYDLRLMGLTCTQWSQMTRVQKLDAIRRHFGDQIQDPRSPLVEQRRLQLERWIAETLTRIDRYCLRQGVQRIQRQERESTFPQSLGSMSLSKQTFFPAGQVAFSETTGTSLLSLAFSLALIGGAAYAGSYYGAKRARSSR